MKECKKALMYGMGGIVVAATSAYLLMDKQSRKECATFITSLMNGNNSNCNCMKKGN